MRQPVVSLTHSMKPAVAHFVFAILCLSSVIADIEYKAIVVVHGNSTNHVKGVITLEEDDDNIITLKGSLSGLLPEGNHGFHIHEFGDCSAPDFTSAGPHFNPKNKDHGEPGSEDRHVGDMGNVIADVNGNVTIQVQNELARLKLTSDRCIIGRALVIHEKEDDLGKGTDEESKKTGNAGKRVGCGVIGIAKVPAAR